MTINAIGKVSQIGFKGVEASQETKKQIPEMKPDTFEKQGEEGAEKKSKTPLYTALALLGATAVGIGIGIKTGKIKSLFGKKGAQEVVQNAQETASEVKDSIVTKFLNKEGKEVQVAFPDKNGIAKVGDDLFNGKLEKVITKGGEEKKILVEYVDGKPRETFINDVLRKKIRHLDDNSKAIEIYDENGSILKSSNLYFDSKNGKLSRIFNKNESVSSVDWGKATDFANGKVQAKTEFGPYGLLKAEIFDDDGNIVKTIQASKQNSTGGFWDIITKDDSGSKIVTARGRLENPLQTRAVDLKHSSPTNIYYTKDRTNLAITELASGHAYDFRGKYGGQITMAIDPKSMTTKNGGSKPASVLTFDEWGADNIKPLNTVSFVNGNIENSSITGIKPAFVDQINKMLEMLQKEGIQLDMPLDEIQKAVKKI
ncbi:hypothetical protein IJC60_05575 [bacterium]|nr:hypothetical protein [bacterium]